MVRARRGYTLIELLLVVGILGLAGALLIPYLGDRGDFDVQAAVRRLVADMTFAQSDALANQEHRRLVFLADPDNEGQFRGWAIIKINEDELAEDVDLDAATYVQDPLAPVGAQGNYVVDLVNDGRFGKAFVASVDIDGGQQMVTFDELGGTVTPLNQPGTGGSIVIRGGAFTYRLDVDGITGKITVVNITTLDPDLEVVIPPVG